MNAKQKLTREVIVYSPRDGNPLHKQLITKINKYHYETVHCHSLLATHTRTHTLSHSAGANLATPP